jgi:hypothetical protein
VQVFLFLPSWQKSLRDQLKLSKNAPGVFVFSTCSQKRSDDTGGEPLLHAEPLSAPTLPCHRTKRLNSASDTSTVPQTTVSYIVPSLPRFGEFNGDPALSRQIFVPAVPKKPAIESE